MKLSPSAFTSTPRCAAICWRKISLWMRITSCAEAAKWVRKAAEQDYAPAQADLGVMYWNGQGVPQDAVLAYMWLYMAAAQEPDAVEEREFFNANSAHPLENPSVWSNILQNWSQLVLPVGLVFAFGRMVGDPKQGRALLAAMAVVFLVALVVFYWSETRGNPELTALGVDPALGNMEGKDVQFGQVGLALFVDATTGTGTGASNAVLESMMPISGLVALFNLLLGCISPGGVGTGLYSLLLLVFITAFIGALMIGRTPEYLGKKIATRDMQLALLALLVSPALVLIFAGASSILKIALDSLGAAGPHGLSEIVYAYASSAADNGSSFAGLNANTPWYNVTTGIAMFFGRFAHAIPILAIAGSLAAKKKAKPSAGTMPTDGPLFILFLLAVIVIVTLLQYLPALALGPIAEHFFAAQGQTF